jgi:hypothetical protein
LKVQVGFCLCISSMYTLCFNQINSPITYSFSITMLPHYSTVYNQLQSIIFIYRSMFQYFSFSNIVFPSSAPHSPFRQTH